MTWLDRSLQRWRIAKAAPWIPPGSRVLDIGCGDGALFRQLGIRKGLGIDPTLSSDAEVGAVKLIAGRFPERLPAAGELFDIITILAVIEHVQPAELSGFLLSCARSLQPAGRVIVTVPSPRVDIILAVLRWLRLIHGMSLEEHHGFAVEQMPRLFGEAGFALIHRRSFQLGLNHLFVFGRRPDDNALTARGISR